MNITIKDGQIDNFPSDKTVHTKILNSKKLFDIESEYDFRRSYHPNQLTKEKRIQYNDDGKVSKDLETLHLPCLERTTKDVIQKSIMNLVLQRINPFKYHVLGFEASVTIRTFVIYEPNPLIPLETQKIEGYDIMKDKTETLFIKGETQ